MKKSNQPKEIYTSPGCEVVAIEPKRAIAVVSGGDYNGFDPEIKW